MLRFAAHRARRTGRPGPGRRVDRALRPRPAPPRRPLLARGRRPQGQRRPAVVGARAVLLVRGPQAARLRRGPRPASCWAPTTPDTGYVSLVFLPPERAAPLRVTAVDKQHALGVLGASYSANAYPFSTLHQNCNQWVMELLADAWGATRATRDAATPDARARAQAWMRAQGYLPTVFTASAHPMTWLPDFVPWLANDDHPPHEVANNRYNVSMPASIETFVQATGARRHAPGDLPRGPPRGAAPRVGRHRRGLRGRPRRPHDRAGGGLEPAAAAGVVEAGAPAAPTLCLDAAARPARQHHRPAAGAHALAERGPRAPSAQVDQRQQDQAGAGRRGRARRRCA